MDYSRAQGLHLTDALVPHQKRNHTRKPLCNSKDLQRLMDCCWVPGNTVPKEGPKSSGRRPTNRAAHLPRRSTGRSKRPPGTACQAKPPAHRTNIHRATHRAGATAQPVRRAIQRSKAAEQLARRANQQNGNRLLGRTDLVRWDITSHARPVEAVPRGSGKHDAGYVSLLNSRTERPRP